LKHPYELSDTTREKIEKIATKIYGAKTVIFDRIAKRKIAELEALGYANLPVCIAKTQYSLSDDPKLLGCPKDFDFYHKGRDTMRRSRVLSCTIR